MNESSNVDVRMLLIALLNSTLTKEETQNDENIVEIHKMLKDLKFNINQLTKEELETLGCYCTGDLALMPAYLFTFIDQNEIVYYLNKDGDVEEITMKEYIDKYLEEGDNNFGTTNCGIKAKSDSYFDVMTNLTFGDAFKKLQSHMHENDSFIMRRPGWSPDVMICVQVPDEGSKMTHPYLYVESRYGRVPWKETVPEMFSVDWEVYRRSVYEEIIEQKAEEEAKNRAKLFNMNAATKAANEVLNDNSVNRLSEIEDESVNYD